MTYTQNWVSFAVDLTLMTVEDAPFARCGVRCGVSTVVQVISLMLSISIFLKRQRERFKVRLHTVDDILVHLRIKYSVAIEDLFLSVTPSPRGDDTFEELHSLTCGAAMESTICTLLLISFSLNSVSSRL